jgi:UDP-N-acetylglucosamine acyltransferase
MSCNIDPRAAISPDAQLGENVTVGPFAVIGPKVQVGDNCVIGPHVNLSGRTTIGRGTKIHVGANIGDEPQDLHYNGELSYVDIGENCVIREYVTIHRGTEEGSHTVVGNNVLLMAFVHLGHNCQIGDEVVIANASLLAGRVEVAPHAFISGDVKVHQFVRIGRLAMIGGGNAVKQDVPPFCLLQDNAIQSPNIVGLRRSGLDDATRHAIRNAIKIYFFNGLNRMNAMAEIREKVADLPEIREFLDFVGSTSRGITAGHQPETAASKDAAPQEP